jgi:hypothetical protein
MASEASFDIVSKVEMPEVVNAVTQAQRELSQRYDFKGSKSSIELNQDKAEITLVSDDEPKMRNVIDVLQTKFVARKVSLKALSYGKIEPASGGTVRQVLTLQQGISTERAKEIVKIIKGMKVKVQAEIQADQVRVKGKKLDDLQAVMAELRSREFDYPMEFTNYR